VATEAARTRVARSFGGPDIIVTGCPSIDLAAEALKLGPIHRAEVVVLQHPVTGEVEQAGAQMRETIRACGLEALYFWPGEDAGADAMSKELRLAGIHPVRNLEPVEFLRVLLGAKVLVGNSSVGIRECSFLGVPVVNIGTRQAGRDRAGNVCDVQHVEALIAQAVSVQAQHGPYPSSNLYGDGYAGERIAKALMEWEA
jgi:hypothetical protein